MGLNDIQLTGASLVDLYSSTLVDTGDIPGLPAVVSSPVAAATSGGPAVAAPPVAPAGSRSAGFPAPPVEPASSAAPIDPAASAVPIDSAASASPAVAASPVAPAALTGPAASATLPTPAAAHRADPAPSVAAPPASANACSQVSGPPADDWKFLGHNKRQVLVVVDYAGAAYLPDEELAFLTRMLTACKLGLADVAIVNSAHYPQYASADYLRRFRSTVVLLFGRDPESFGLPIAFPHFQVQSFAGVTFLSAPVLGGMMENTALKTSLWLGLKRIFNL